MVRRLVTMMMLAWGCAGDPVRTHAASGPLRLSGSFFQYQAEMRTWDAAAWRTILDRMKAAQMNTVIVQMLVAENSDGSTTSFIGPTGKEDATEAILNYGDTNGFRVYLGLYMPRWGADITASNFLSRQLTLNLAVAQQAYDRYLRKAHGSFAGWYLPLEPWTQNLQSDQISRLRDFFRSVHDGCAQISGHWPLAISPAISADRPPPCDVERVYTQLLDQAGIDLVLWQDSVGAQQWQWGIRERVAPCFAAFQRACAANGVRLWANLETFQIAGGQFLPADTARLRQQFAATAPFVDDFVTFDFLNYMNPAVFLSWWDQARRDQMRKLYANYLTEFVETDYAPCGPLNLVAAATGASLQLSWTAGYADVFQLQLKTNLDAPGWETLAVEIPTNGYQRSVTLPIEPRSAARFYRLQNRAHLVVPDNMVWVPPGSFLMGTPSDDPYRTSLELPSFPASLTRGFWISRFELTQWEYQSLTCTNPSAILGNVDAPVEMVSRQDANAYCARLTLQERQAGRLTADYVYRLPSEAEWEYAARAGSTNWFGFGDSPAPLADYGWFDANSGATTHAVGQLTANPWGLYDWQGNVLEWCRDWLPEAPSPAVDPLGTTNGTYSAARGGAWDLPAKDCRASWRSRFTPVVRRPDLGCRIILAPAEP